MADIGKVVRDVNPDDPWNMTHPAEYLAGLSAIGAGLVHDAVHPQDLVGQMVGGGWGSDPFDGGGQAGAPGGAGAGHRRRRHRRRRGGDAATGAAARRRHGPGRDNGR